jgi:hypothetical protein
MDATIVPESQPAAESSRDGNESLDQRYPKTGGKPITTITAHTA